MYKSKKILALIPARAGSKGIPKKNIKNLGGIPLIAWTINAAKKSQYIDKLIISTDSAEIASVAYRYGCEVPFTRPADLAQDNSGSMEVIMHALEVSGNGFDYFLLLQPTSPFRTTQHIDEIIRRCINEGAKQMVSVARVRKHPSYLYQINDDNTLTSFLPASRQLRRQDMGAAFEHNGALYFSNITYLKSKKSYITKETTAYVTNGPINLDLDTLDDWMIAEHYLQRMVL